MADPSATTASIWLDVLENGLTPTAIDRAGASRADRAEVTDANQLVTGQYLLSLRAHGRGLDWATRRFDTIQFPDWAHQRRVTRLEVDLANMLADEETYPRWNGALLLPVMALRRFTHRTIEIHDEAGAQVVKLSGAHERRLLTLGLLALAQNVLGADLPTPLVALFGDIVLGRRSITFADYDGPYRAIRQALTACDEFMSLLRDVADVADLVAVLPTPSATRRSLTTTVVAEPRYVGRSSGMQRLVRLIAPQPGQFLIYPIGVRDLDARSFHIEVNAPYDLEIPVAALFVYYTARAVIAQKPDETLVSDSPDRTSAHVHRAGSERVVDRAEMIVELVPCPTGVMRSSFVSVNMISLILALGAGYISVTTPTHLHAVDRASTVSLLLLAPAILAVVLVTPSRHSLTTRYLLGARVTVVLSCVLLFVGAVTVALELAASEAIWIASAAVGLLLSTRISYQWQWLLRQRRRADARRYVASEPISYRSAN